MKKALLGLLLTLNALAQPAVEKRVDGLLAQMSTADKLRLIGGTRGFYTQAIPRLGIPELKMSDGPMGVRCFGLSTAYPAPIALAASFDTSLARRIGESLGQDARAFGVHVLLAPGMNLYRAPMCSRNFEYLGEDPKLAGQMAVNYIQGVQSQGVMATAKHFACNNNEYGRMDHSSDLDERSLRELYLPAFEASVKEAKVACIMDAYNLVNGVHMTENSHLNSEIAKQEWGFDGFIMSDWGATHNGLAAANAGLDLEMPSPAYMNPQTLEPALKEGRLNMATLDDKVRRILRKAVQFGFLDRPQTDARRPAYSQNGRQVSLETARAGTVLLKNDNHLLPLDRKKTRSILVIGPHAYPAVPGGGGSSETRPFRAISLLQGISDTAGPDVRVLYAPEEVDMKTLVERTSYAGPLKVEYFANAKLQGTPALIGQEDRIDHLYEEGSFAPGGPVDDFSARWSGTFVAPRDDDYRFFVSSDDGVRLYVEDKCIVDDWTPHSQKLEKAGLRLKAGQSVKFRLEYFEAGGDASVHFGIAGSDLPLDSLTRTQASQADAVVVCVGFMPSQEYEGDDRSFQLPAGQAGLIRELADLNKHVIVVLTAGGNVDMEGWLDKVPALLHAWYPGQEGGTAIAQLLFGDYSPSGKLPASFEARWQDNPTHDSYYPNTSQPKHVNYSEGLFMGYRHYDKATVKPRFPFGFGLSYTTFQFSDLQLTPIGAAFTVKNTGSRKGAEVAQLYVGDTHSPVPRPLKELKGFARVELAPGQSRRVHLPLSPRDFSYWDSDTHDWKLQPGQFDILVGNSSTNTPLRASLNLGGPAAPSRR
jgi:beta-glucosidase